MKQILTLLLIGITWTGSLAQPVEVLLECERHTPIGSHRLEEPVPVEEAAAAAVTGVIQRRQLVDPQVARIEVRLHRKTRGCVHQHRDLLQALHSENSARLVPFF